MLREETTHCGIFRTPRRESVSIVSSSAQSEGQIRRDGIGIPQVARIGQHPLARLGNEAGESGQGDELARGEEVGVGPHAVELDAEAERLLGERIVGQALGGCDLRGVRLIADGSR